MTNVTMYIMFSLGLKLIHFRQFWQLDLTLYIVHARVIDSMPEKPGLYATSTCVHVPDSVVYQMGK